MTLYAHSANKDGTWHTLEDHLLETAEIARDSCSIDRLKDVAYNLGIIHDLGKAHSKFQSKLTGESRESFDHPGYSIFLVENMLMEELPYILNDLRFAEIVCGHHKGLQDISGKKERLFKVSEEVRDFVQSIKKNLKQVNNVKINYYDSLFLFSWLCSSDWVDTSRHFQTYIKRENHMPLNVEERIRGYLNGFSK